MADRQIKVVFEASKGDKVYQRTTFEQFYDTKEQQLAEQIPMLEALTDTIARVLPKPE